MNEPQEHSEGPWQANGFLVLSKDLSTVCHTGGTRFKDGQPSPLEAEANARLIASSPCLLAALEELLRDKMAGETNPACLDDEAVVPRPLTWGALRRGRAAIAKAKGTLDF